MIRPYGEATLRWYALHTHAKQEDRAESNLLAWNMETFVPRILCQRRHPFSPEPSFFVKPLFPRYIFARFDAEETLHKIRFTRGVHSVVSVGNSPAPIEDELIEIIKSRRGPDNFIRLDDDLKAGDPVLVKEGPFSGFPGVFERKTKDSKRVMILLKMVSTHIHLTVPAADVEKLSGRPRPTPRGSGAREQNQPVRV